MGKRSAWMRVCAALLGLWALGMLFGASRADAAAPHIVAPTQRPYHVALDANGKPIAFTVTAAGYPQFTQVFVEQCDGRQPSEPNWSPAVDCDDVSGQSPATADKHGVATFTATDPNVALQPFIGQSPQAIFNCIAPHSSAPNNGLPTFTNCQIRVATNPVKATEDQLFVPLVLGGSNSSSSLSPWLFVAIIAGVVLVVAAVIGGIARTRRNRPKAAQGQPAGASASARERSASRR
jgi:hypothetical protein